MLCQFNLTGLKCFAYALELSSFRIKPFVSHVKTLYPSNILWALKRNLSSTRLTANQLVKDETLISCTQSQLGQYLTVPITIEDEVSFINKYSLIATINHSGTLSRGHYWACIKDLHSPCWYLCNDKLVSNVEESYLNNTTLYILFYSKV